MMLPQYLNDIRTMTTTAARHGVTIPGDFAAKAEHLTALDIDHRVQAAPDVAHIAAELAKNLGDPAVMSKARFKAANELAIAEADNRIRTTLVDRCAVALHSQMRANAAAIIEAFEPAVADAIKALNQNAAKLPRNFRSDDAATLDPATFTAWSRARDAQALIESLFPALRPLYRTPADNVLTADAIRALRYVKPPTLENPPQAHTFARALAGTRHGGSELGPLTVQDLFAPALVAHLGATFEWATPDEVADRAASIVKAATPQTTLRRGRGPQVASVPA